MRGNASRVLVVLVLSTLMATFVGMNTATGQTVLHLVMPAETLKTQEFDQHANGLGLGDRVTARASLTDGGSEVGTAYADCVLHRRVKPSGTGLWTCDYVLDLEDGDLNLKGLDPRGPGAYEMAVLGGTGIYANASGDASFNDTFNETTGFDETEMVIRLSN